MPHFHHTKYEREEGAWLHMSVRRCSVLAFMQTCCRRAETLRQGCMVVMYVRVCFPECPMMTQIRLPLLNSLLVYCRLRADLLCCLPAEDLNEL